LAGSAFSFPVLLRIRRLGLANIAARGRYQRHTLDRWVDDESLDPAVEVQVGWLSAVRNANKTDDELQECHYCEVFAGDP
jgi:hypothetical protein